MTKPLTAGEKIARDLCEMGAPIDNIIEVDPVDVARRIDEEVFSTLDSLADCAFRNERLVADYASLQEENNTLRRIHAENLAIKDTEIARLKTVPMKYRRMEFNAQLQSENASLKEQVMEQAKEIERLGALSVTNILIDVVPGDGSGEEVFATSVTDVVSLLTQLSEKAEDYDLEVRPLRQQLAEMTERARKEYISAIDWAGKHQELSEQLVESQAREGKLRDALQKVVDTPHMQQDRYTLSALDAAIAGLSVPSDDTALREALAAARSAGVEVAIKYLKKKADDFAATYGSDDLGSLSFGRGNHAEAKFDYYNSLLDLAEEVAALKGEAKEDL